MLTKNLCKYVALLTDAVIVLYIAADGTCIREHESKRDDDTEDTIT